MTKEVDMEKERHQNFIRISWQEAFDAMHSALEQRYQTKGKLELKKDYGYDGIGDFYDEPTFVDLYLKEENRQAPPTNSLQRPDPHPSLEK